MQTDVNQAKSRSFNIHLRFFQLGLCLMFTFLVDRFFNVTCAQSSFQIINIMGISMAIISLGAIVWQIFKKYHQKLFFIVVFSINILLGTIIIIFSAASYHQSATCPTKTFLYIYYLTNIPMYFIQALMILFMPFFWVQRFTNSPGSAVWPFLFFIFASQTSHVVIMVLIGLLSLISNVLTWSTNGLALLNGVSTTLKKILWVTVIISLVFTVICEIMALFIVFTVPTVDFKHTLVKSMLESFLLVNFVDLVFWFFGMMSLNYENGDVVRDGLLDQGGEE